MSQFHKVHISLLEFCFFLCHCRNFTRASRRSSSFQLLHVAISEPCCPSEFTLTGPPKCPHLLCIKNCQGTDSLHELRNIEDLAIILANYFFIVALCYILNKKKVFQFFINDPSKKPCRIFQGANQSQHSNSDHMCTHNCNPNTNQTIELTSDTNPCSAN